MVHTSEKAFKWTSDLQDLQAPKRPTDASEMAKRWFKSQMFDGVSEDFLGGAEQSRVNEAAGRRN